MPTLPLPLLRSPLLPQVALRDVEATLAPFGQALPLPAAVYRDPITFEWELGAIFQRAWLCAGRGADVSAPGAWMRPPLPWDAVVVRGHDLDVRAFLNVCRHRGAELTTEPRGRAAAFACPYHGWTYGLDGRLTAAPFAPEGFHCESHGLHSVELQMAADFVFCRFESASFDEPGPASAAGLPPWLQTTELRHLRLAFDAEWETRANWKLVVENFQESHHFTRVHRHLEAITQSDDARSVLGDGSWLGGTMSIGDAHETVSESGKRCGRPFIVAPERRRTVFDAMLFPSWLTSLQPDYLLSYRLLPRAVDRTQVRFEVFVHPEAPRGEAVRDLEVFWTRINGEDRAICESQQRGLAAPGYAPGCFASVEDGVHAFQARVARAYRKALA